MSIVQGEDAVFTCAVTKSSFTVKWAKEGRAIKKSQKYEISQEENVMKLTIHSVCAQDSGEYSCEVVGGATTSAKLEIKGMVIVAFSRRPFLTVTQLSIAESSIGASFTMLF